jgi:hypothetical protein
MARIQTSKRNQFLQVRMTSQEKRTLDRLVQLRGGVPASYIVRQMLKDAVMEIEAAR